MFSDCYQYFLFPSPFSKSFYLGSREGQEERRRKQWVISPLVFIMPEFCVLMFSEGMVTLQFPSKSYGAAIAKHHKLWHKAQRFNSDHSRGWEVEDPRYMCIWLSGGLVSYEGKELCILTWWKAEVQIAKMCKRFFMKTLIHSWGQSSWIREPYGSPHLLLYLFPTRCQHLYLGLGVQFIARKGCSVYED